MSADTFLDELDGGLVQFLRADATIRSHVGGDDSDDTNARIFAEAPRHGALRPYIFYTQSDGSSVVNHSGADGAVNMIIHVYAEADSPNTARALANRIRDLMVGLGTGEDEVLADGTKVLVCNGGIVDSGYRPAEESSDRKKFWVRLVLRLLLE